MVTDQLYAQLEGSSLDRWPEIIERYWALEKFLKSDDQSLVAMNALASRLGVTTRTIFRLRAKHVRGAKEDRNPHRLKPIDQIILRAVERCGTQASSNQLLDVCGREARGVGINLPSSGWMTRRIRHLRRDVGSIRDLVDHAIVIDCCKLDVTLTDNGRAWGATDLLVAYDPPANRIVSAALFDSKRDEHVLHAISQVSERLQSDQGVVATEAVLAQRARDQLAAPKDQLRNLGRLALNDLLPAGSVLTAIFGNSLAGIPIRERHIDRREPKHTLTETMVRQAIFKAVEMRNAAADPATMARR